MARIRVLQVFHHSGIRWITFKYGFFSCCVYISELHRYQERLIKRSLFKVSFVLLLNSDLIRIAVCYIAFPLGFMFISLLLGFQTADALASWHWHSNVSQSYWFSPLGYQFGCIERWVVDLSKEEWRMAERALFTSLSTLFSFICILNKASRLRIALKALPLLLIVVVAFVSWAWRLFDLLRDLLKSFTLFFITQVSFTWILKSSYCRTRLCLSRGYSWSLSGRLKAGGHWKLRFRCMMTLRFDSL